MDVDMNNFNVEMMEFKKFVREKSFKIEVGIVRFIFEFPQKYFFIRSCFALDFLLQVQNIAGGIFHLIIDYIIS